MRPRPPIDAAWPDPPSAEGQRIAAQTDWRSFFPDPRLQALIAAALENNRDLRIAVGRVAEARAQYGVVRADRLPTVNLGTGRNAALTPGDLGGTEQSASGQRYDVSLTSISYEVDFWGRVSGLAESALASVLASEQSQQAARISLISEVANAYFALLEAEERTTVARRTLASREESRNLIAKGLEAGFASRLDLLQATGTVESAKSDLAAMERQRAAAANLLQSLVGGPMPGELPSGRTLFAQDIVPDLVAGLPAEVLLARPDVRAAEQRLIAAHANVGAARAAFLPKILLTGLFGTASRTLSGLFTSGSQTWAFQPTISMPLFDNGRVSSNADLAEARRNIAVADYEKTIQQAFREVADLLAARTTLIDQMRAAEENLKAQEERFKIANVLFAGGVISQLDVLEIQREYSTAQQLAIQVRRTQLTAAAQLYKALGGGG